MAKKHIKLEECGDTKRKKKEKKKEESWRWTCKIGQTLRNHGSIEWHVLSFQL